MIYPKISQKYQNTNFLLIVILSLFLPIKAYSQLDSAYFMGVHIEVGPSFALGSFSKYSATPNSLGKNIIGLNVNADAEIFLKNKYVLSFGLNGIACMFKNDSLSKYIKRKRSNIVDPSYGTDSVGIAVITGMSIGLSRLFVLGNFVLEPKVLLNAGYIYYEFTLSYPVINSSGIGPGSYNYTLKDCAYATIIPELNMKYFFKRKRKLDVALNIGISYNYYMPKVTILESFSNNSQSSYSGGNSNHYFSTINGKMSFLNVHGGLTLYLKKKYRRK